MSPIGYENRDFSTIKKIILTDIILQWNLAKKEFF